MKKLSLLLGAIALVLIAMLTLGCENATEEKTITVNAGFEGTVVANETNLAAKITALNGAKGTVAYVGGALGGNVTEIPATLTLNVYSEVTLGGTVTVKGTVNVKGTGKLTASGAYVLQIGDNSVNDGAGTVNVEAGGELVLAVIGTNLKFAPASAGAYVAAALADFADNAASGIVTGDTNSGSENAKLVFAEGAIFTQTDGGGIAVTDAADLQALANAKFITTIASTTGVTAITGDLTIKKGTTVTSATALAPTGKLTVNGALTTSGAAAPAENVEVSGSLTVLSSTFTVAEGKTLTITGTLTLTGTLAGTGTVTTSGSGKIDSSADYTANAAVANTIGGAITALASASSAWDAVDSSEVTISAAATPVDLVSSDFSSITLGGTTTGIAIEDDTATLSLSVAEAKVQVIATAKPASSSAKGVSIAEGSVTATKDGVTYKLGAIDFDVVNGD